MNELMEIKFRILELAYTHNKPIKDVMLDLKKIRIQTGEHTQKSEPAAQKSKPAKQVKSTPAPTQTAPQPTQPAQPQEPIQKPMIDSS